MIRKPQHVIPDMEDLEHDYRYCFTYNPCDKYQHFKTHDRTSSFMQDMDKLFYHNCYSLELYPELSKKGRYHYHGYITIHDKVLFYLFAVPVLIANGTMHIVKEEPPKPDSKYKSWQEYITKQSIFHEYIEENHYKNIPFTFTRKRMTNKK